MKITIPDFCLVVLIGTSGSGKSTFAKNFFLDSEVVSSDRCREIVSDDENSLDATDDAFRLVHFIAETRLKRRKLAVIDATNVRSEDRAHLVRIARAYHALAVAIVLNPGEQVCRERNELRPNRQFGSHVIRNQTRNLKRNIRRLDREGFRYVYEFRSVEDIDAVEMERVPLWTDKRSELGPFDIVGDVHGCADELIELLSNLGYSVSIDGAGDGQRAMTQPPPGRRALFVGDLVDRGPNSPDVLRIVMDMVDDGHALAVPGNHDVKLFGWLKGKKVRITHGLEQTVAQLERESEHFKARVKKFIDDMVSHYWLDEGRLAIAHAGIKEEMIGRSSGAVRRFCYYGETSGETDEFGLPIRYNWAAEYRGATTVVYGHTPVPEAEWLNNTLCIDTGCVFGGKLTALRWPEKEIISVSALKTYAEPVRPLGHPPARPGAELTAQAVHDDLLDLDDVLGKRIVSTRLGRSVSVHEANAAAALEVMTRFAIHSKWLVYLPPTMSPCATSDRDGFLEHPDQAFGYYAQEGVKEIVVQEKHMGSRAVAVVCRDEQAAARHFGVVTGETGAIYTRTGRAFFSDPKNRDVMLTALRQAMEACDFWERFESDWAVLDAEILPWSAKAQGLIKDQYAPTGAAAKAGLGFASEVLEEACAAGLDLQPVAEKFRQRRTRAQAYVNAYRNYCWPVHSIQDYRFAPFHLLASDGNVHMDRNHVWHMNELKRICDHGSDMLMTTPFLVVDVECQSEISEATAWWSQRTEAGGEGMVVKPKDFIARGKHGAVQPAVKCRGSEYLRIIYGPEYDLPGNLKRLRQRGLGHKRSLAMREFALGYEALHRFVEKAPLRQVHECVFAVLALESEPVDPRL